MKPEVFASQPGRHGQRTGRYNTIIITFNLQWIKQTFTTTNSIRAMFTKARGKQKRLTSYFKGEQQQQNQIGLSATASRKRPRPVPPPSSSSSLSSSLSSGCSFRSRNGGSGFGVCPLCQSSIAWHVLESHASKCTGNDSSSSSSSNHGVGTTTATGNDKTPQKASFPMTRTQIPLESDEIGEIIPLDVHEPEFPKTRTPKATTKSTACNIVTPRLAPIFQAKQKGENTNNDALQQHHPQQLQPHSYEPIPGLFVYEDFITEEEESLILKGCCVNNNNNNVDRDAVPAWKVCRFNGNHIGKRWGVHCNLRDRRVDAPEHPLPNVLRDIVFPKLKGLLNLKNFVPNEANAIDYGRNKGHWLKAHVDDRKLSKEPIANLSLVGDCYMTFRNVARHRNLAVPEQRVLLKRRCLQVLTGKARYDFSHGIANVDLLSDRRVSITMRESPLTAARAATATATTRTPTFARPMAC